MRSTSARELRASTGRSPVDPGPAEVAAPPAVPTQRRGSPSQAPADGRDLTPGALIALARARLHGGSLTDAVPFTAACPACGGDWEWVGEREDTRLRITIDCPCEPT